MYQRAAHSLGFGSIFLGLLALSVSWIPGIGLLGLPFSIGGLLLALGGGLVAVSRRGNGIGYALTGALVCVVAIAYSLLSAKPLTHRVGGFSIDEPQPAAPEEKPESEELPTVWTPGTQPIQVGDALVRLGSATVRNVPLVGRNGDSSSTPTPYLMVPVWVSNVGKNRKLDYQGWGSAGPSGSATLTDEFDNDYRRVLPSDSLGRVLGQLQEVEPLYPGDMVSDVIVFEAPVEGVRELRLRLESANVGGEGNLQFSIPGGSIKRRLVRIETEE